METALLSEIQPDWIHYEDILDYHESEKYCFKTLSISITDSKFDFFHVIYHQNDDCYNLIFPVEYNDVRIINDIDNEDYFTAPPIVLAQLENYINSIWGDEIIKRIENKYKESVKFNNYNKIPNLYLRVYISNNNVFTFRKE